MIFNRTRNRCRALGGFLLCAFLALTVAKALSAEHRVEDGVSYAVVIHEAHDMTQASQAGSLLCRNELGLSSLAEQYRERYSLPTLKRLVATQGLRVRAIGIQRETRRDSGSLFRTHCYASVGNITPVFVTEPSSSDIANARLEAGVGAVFKGEHRQGLEILQKLRSNASNYQNSLPAIVAALLYTDQDLARKVDQGFLNLKEVTFLPSLKLYREAVQEAGWERRLIAVENRLEVLLGRPSGRVKSRDE